MGSNQSRPEGPEGPDALEASTTDSAGEALGNVQPARPRSPSSYHLSLTGRLIIGDDGAKLFFPCPISTALTVHHHNDFVAIEVPVHYIVRHAGLFDLAGAQRLLTRFVDAIKNAVVRVHPKQIRLANEAEFQVGRFEAGYASEIASMFYSMILGYIDEYNKANISAITTATDMPTGFPMEQQPTLVDERQTEPVSVPASQEIDGFTVLVDAATEQPSLKRKASSLIQQTRCDNCGEKHDKTMCRAACRSCGQLHPDRERRCPREADQCWCETYPRHTHNDVRDAGRLANYLSRGHALTMP